MMCTSSFVSMLCIVFCYCILILFLLFVSFFFFKQKTAYEMRISDWSSDVCSSDLTLALSLIEKDRRAVQAWTKERKANEVDLAVGVRPRDEIGRASCRERVCQYV